MIRLIAVCLIISLISGKTFSQQNPPVKIVPEFSLTKPEIELYKLINAYRKEKGLPTVKLSTSLCYVARTHARDQEANFKQGTSCNMHSWSQNTTWSSCCYTPDHKQGKCMWDKPRELTNYTGDGFEISFWSTYQDPDPVKQAKDILDGWKGSQGHNDVITNRNTWKNVEWKAIGIGIYGEYADVWFGEVDDSAGTPKSGE